MISKPLKNVPPGPKLRHSLSELPRAATELATLLPAMPWVAKLGGGRGRPVMVLPGFGADDYSTVVLRKLLNRWGYDARPWAMGQNLNPREITDTLSALEQIESNLDVLADRLFQINEDTGTKISLIGWSLGGIVARQLAARYPELVSRVITLGTPFGDFRSTVVYPIMQRVRKNVVTPQDLNAWHQLANIDIGDIPLTLIYSDSDGFVPPSNATSTRSSRIEYIKIRGSHIGLTVNPNVIRLLADRLRCTTREWQPFESSRTDRIVFGTQATPI